jgi:hypothetical protein
MPPPRDPAGIASALRTGAPPATVTSIQISLTLTLPPGSTCTNTVPGLQLFSVSQPAPASAASAQSPTAAAVRREAESTRT